MRISIMGLGYVGVVSMACLVRDGHDVVGVDVDPVKLGLIRDGKSPIVEEGIQDLVAAAAASGRMRVTDDAAEAIAASELTFVCVGTPSNRNGSLDLSAIVRVTEQIGSALAGKRGPHVVIYRSTMLPGTVDGTIRPVLESKSGRRVGSDLGLGFQPEFLREGSSIRDYDNPPFTVVGGDSERTTEAVAGIFRHLPCETFTTTTRTAEMLKYACNMFHALKITFANEIGRLSQGLDVDSHEVMSLACKDTRLNISTAYMKPGFAFGGSCLPKDLRAMLYAAKDRDIDVPMLRGVMPSNRAHVDHAFDIVMASGRRTVGMIGLSFKSGTDDLRESPFVVLAEKLIGKGLDLAIYDPEVHLSRLIGANRRYIEETIPHIGTLLSADCGRVVSRSDVLVVGLSTPEVERALLDDDRTDRLILDLVRLPFRERLGSGYRGVCW